MSGLSSEQARDEIDPALSAREPQSRGAAGNLDRMRLFGQCVLDCPASRVDRLHHVVEHGVGSSRHRRDLVSRGGQLCLNLTGQLVDARTRSARRQSAGLGFARPVTAFNIPAITLAADIEREVAYDACPDRGAHHVVERGKLHAVGTQEQRVVFQ